MADLLYPADLRYAKTHEWVRVEGDVATIGITDFAQNELGDIVDLTLPWSSAGRVEFVAGRHFGDIDSVKLVSELFAPVSGKLIEVNDSLRDDYTKVNSDPYGDGWMLKIQISNPAELDSLMKSEDYQHFCATEGH